VINVANQNIQPIFILPEDTLRNTGKNAQKINIAAVSLANNDDASISIFLSLEAANLAQLSRLLAKVEGIRGVIHATRIGEGATTK